MKVVVKVVMKRRMKMIPLCAAAGMNGRRPFVVEVVRNYYILYSERPWSGGTVVLDHGSILEGWPLFLSSLLLLSTGA